MFSVVPSSLKIEFFNLCALCYYIYTSFLKYLLVFFCSPLDCFHTFVSSLLLFSYIINLYLSLLINIFVLLHWPHKYSSSFHLRCYEMLYLDLPFSLYSCSLFVSIFKFLFSFCFYSHIIVFSIYGCALYFLFSYICVLFSV